MTARFKAPLQQFRDDRKKYKANLQRNGFLTTRIYKSLDQIMGEQMDPTERQTNLVAVAQEIIKADEKSRRPYEQRPGVMIPGNWRETLGHGEAPSPVVTRAAAKRKAPDQGKKSFSFVTMLQDTEDASTMLSIEGRGTARGLYRAPRSEIVPGTYEFSIRQGPTFSIQAQLCFLHFPIGQAEDTNYFMKGLFDTGGCCNMGQFAWHDAIRQNHPHLIASFTELAASSYEPIKIGGIEGAVEITHLIEYFIPYEDGQGQFYTLQIGLTNTLPLNTLFGLPFIMKANLKPDYKDSIITSSVLNDEFKMTMERPMLLPPEDVEQQVGERKVMFNEQAEEIETQLIQMDMEPDMSQLVV